MSTPELPEDTVDWDEPTVQPYVCEVMPGRDCPGCQEHCGRFRTLVDPDRELIPHPYAGEQRFP